jgi:predicted amidohydrolase
MKLAMAQMGMSENIRQNADKAIDLIRRAKGCDLIFFPEIQFTPFFPQYENKNVDLCAMKIDDDRIREIQSAARENALYVSPNLYLKQNQKRYDASLWITPDGEVKGIASMVHVLQAKCFYEKDYYAPSETGFRVFRTPWGKVGIVICFDRHLPESIRTCALLGAQLVIIPTANTADEPLTMFEWEIRVQAMQNQVFIAMCNRIGTEGAMDFAGESLVANPDGEILFKADRSEQLILSEFDLKEVEQARIKRPYLALRRPEFYK